MAKAREQLIVQLSNEVTRIKVTSLLISIFFWLSIAFSVSTFLMLAIAPFRENSLLQLSQSNQFLIENIVGFVCIVILIYAAYDSAIPSPKAFWQRVLIPLLALLSWLGFYIYGLCHPALAFSTLGLRHYCWLEIFVYGLIVMSVALFWVKKQWPVSPGLSGLFVGLASGAVPALLMQFGCMYQPEHTLRFHILPALLVGAVGYIVGTRFLKK